MELFTGAVILVYHKKADIPIQTLEYFDTISYADARYKQLVDSGYDVVWNRLEVDAKGQIKRG